MAEAKQPKKTSKREGITRFPLELEDELAERFDKARAKAYPLGSRNAVLRVLIEKFVKEILEKK